MGDVAQRPEALVGEAVVVAGLLFLAQPDAVDVVGRMLRRHGDAILPVDHLAVGAAAAMRDPGARAGAHDRLQRGDEAARRPLHLDAVAAADMDVGLAVGDDQHVLAGELAVQDGAQGFRLPGQLRIVARADFRFHLADQHAQVAGDRLELRRGLGLARFAQQPLAAQQGAHALDPAAPG
jgi:hypothetical protein